MTVGSGIAIAAMWLAVAAIGWQTPVAALLPCVFAAIVTAAACAGDHD